MAYQSVWYFTDLPADIISIIERDVADRFDKNMQDSRVSNSTGQGSVNTIQRNSANAWIPTTHWVGGFMWHYVQRANRENFLYDIRHIHGESMQYTRYGPGQYYHWHNDAGLSGHYSPECHGKGTDEQQARDFVNSNIEMVRKLSFTLQLSDPDDYEGGNVQLLDETGKSYIAPRQKGCVILFDSRTQHRVLPVKRGVRKSIVGWTMGPRWK